MLNMHLLDGYVFMLIDLSILVFFCNFYISLPEIHRLLSSPYPSLFLLLLVLSTKCDDQTPGATENRPAGAAGKLCSRFCANHDSDDNLTQSKAIAGI